MYSRTRDFGQKGTYVEAISAIDIALWDIKGKAAGAPIHELLGGSQRDSVYAYATGCYYTEEDIKEPSNAARRVAEEAAGYASDEYAALKVKIGLLPVPEDAKRIAAIRAAIGDDFPLLVDANHAYRAATAIEMGKHLEDHNVGFFEEPVVPENHQGYREIRQALRIPIAGGECEYTRYGFKDLIGNGCVDIAQPDVCAAGGISEFIKIMSIATAHDVLIIPHVWGSGVAVAAALQAIALIPPTPYTYSPIALANEPLLEFDRKKNPLRDEILTQQITIKSGRIDIPQNAGLGVDVDENSIKRFAVKGYLITD